MKKWISLLLVFSLTLLTCSCQANYNDTSPVPETQEPEASEQETEQEEVPEPLDKTPGQPAGTTQVPAEEEMESPVPVDEGEQQTDEDVSACTEEDRAALTAVLDQIRAEARVGVAGSSLTAVQLAAVLLDWGMETPMTETEIQETAPSWYAEMESADQEEFQMQLSGVDGAVEQVMEEKGADLLECAGCTESAYPWNEAARTAVKAVVSAILKEK